ncbi:hypothetical protein IQ03_03082 [Gemmobacter caeni]|uniref:Glycosyl transferase family 2 n=1 Tax=Gemmobacter caeni TaxID=589035 RepID=A0A2T6AVQ4_9RHOB|nr:hypothetical protein [Gemmobacter caeni]PTX47893.1 hypothetical protein C8N34_11146 [Gemmobacter caeni]TWI97385.1 hypothetical protein IQ03_03082 [Gemmobacter caeni]
MPDRFVVAAACASVDILADNLSRSPLLRNGIRLHEEWNAPSAARAYNRALDATTAPVVIFAHQDVYFPAGWERLLAARIAEVEARDSGWGLIGAFGVGLDGAHIGPVWSSSLGMIVGRVPMAPVPVQSFDEMVIVLNRASGLRFDETLSGWHMYGTDIVTQARVRGLGAWAVGLPCIHNDRFHEALGPDYVECYRAVQRKWAARLPLLTPITKISRSGLHLRRDLWRARQSAGFRAGMAVGTEMAAEDLARRCGWLDLGASA